MEYYNQQLKFDFEDKRLIKEIKIKYYEYTDDDGTRRVKKETNEKKWFNEGSNHNPTSCYHSEVI